MQGKPPSRGIWFFLLLLTALSCLWRERYGHFRQDFGIPELLPTGVDFRAVYGWASALWKGGDGYFSAHNVYPPAATMPPFST